MIPEDASPQSHLIIAHLLHHLSKRKRKLTRMTVAECLAKDLSAASPLLVVVAFQKIMYRALCLTDITLMNLLIMVGGVLVIVVLCASFF